MGFRRSVLFALALGLPVPIAGAGAAPAVHEGRFAVSRATPMCIRAPCPPPYWSFHVGNLWLRAERIVIDPATLTSVQEAIRRASGLNSSTVEGRVSLEDGVATVLVRRFTPRPRR
ncbi:hypothetical protein [Roseococcus pinisoli]|uniref:Uncharacterized protein n=1 Tax=Roseococcus pinisoli TaxID=2835040 RepID=A0ABS5QGL9_9PROT|nr:hypothetical protein [Roseococcus pinisoli]MBS7811698.1 hypothetical protein [Roseococcus pinisoli]